MDGNFSDRLRTHTQRHTHTQNMVVLASNHPFLGSIIFDADWSTKDIWRFEALINVLIFKGFCLNFSMRAVP